MGKHAINIGITLLSVGAVMKFGADGLLVTGVALLLFGFVREYYG